MSTIVTWTRQHRLAAFFGLTFLLSWWSWPFYALDLAPTARAIVVGQRRRRATTHVGQLGSTSRGLVTSATCPVLVARAVATRGAGAVPARGD